MDSLHGLAGKNIKNWSFQRDFWNLLVDIRACKWFWVICDFEMSSNFEISDLFLLWPQYNKKFASVMRNPPQVTKEINIILSFEWATKSLEISDSEMVVTDPKECVLTIGPLMIGLFVYLKGSFLFWWQLTFVISQHEKHLFET